MNFPRIALLAACSSLFLVACGGDGAVADEPSADQLTSEEQGLGMPPNCPNGDLFYWTENVKACGTCGTTRNPGQLATQYAACRSNQAQTKTLINVRYCIIECTLALD